MIDEAATAAIWISASPAAAILLKVTVALGAGLVAARLAARGRASVRHAMLSAAMVAALVLPLGVLIAPAIEVPFIVGQGFSPAIVGPGFSPASRSDRELSPGSGPSSGPAKAGPHDFTALVSVGWGLGVLALAAPFVLSMWRLRMLRRDGLPFPRAQAVADRAAAESGLTPRLLVMTATDVSAPFTFGIATATIVLPDAARFWDAAALRRALIHELAHIRRGDWAMHVTARLACAMYWFHPLAWMANRQLALEAERACDDEVVARNDRTEYADQLVALARQITTPRRAPLLGMASRSDLASRVAAVLDQTQPRGRMRRAHGAAIVTVTMAALAGVAPVRAVPRERSLTIVSAPAAAAQPGTSRRRASRLDRALVEAAADGDVTDVKALLDQGANINAAVDGDGSPLIAAARAGDRELVTFLLDRGADVNQVVDGDGSPLIMAAAEGHLAIVELLLAHGADVNTVVPSDETALIQASGNGHLPIVQLLVSRGADVNTRVWADGWQGGGEWRTALSMARRGNHRKVVEFLLSVGATQ
jgi:beta-lactamase regulating signal transducer with metallopeptidase domain